MRDAYNYTCVICLTPLPVEGSQCAHIFDSSNRTGKEQVAHAISLGLLSPTESYIRSEQRNGIIQCPTCHLGYFTPKRLVFSPPVPVLHWIIQKLETATDPGAVRKIFEEFEMTRSPELLPYKDHYSLIPIFRSENPDETYELYYNVPKLSILKAGGTAFETISSSEQAGQNQIYRIFSYKNTRKNKPFRRKAGIVRFTAIPPHMGPTTDYWYIRVDCHIILYLFLQQARGRASTIPEVALAHRIEAKLLEIKIRGTALQPAPRITVDDEAELNVSSFP
ncbi:hypothetical protein B0H11DRAFT_2434274 [Mycena galericulata]|nr:hypothetical protein B0H11DRAFT_2434274 [Mycena galericulata]